MIKKRTVFLLALCVLLACGCCLGEETAGYGWDLQVQVDEKLAAYLVETLALAGGHAMDEQNMTRAAAALQLLQLAGCTGKMDMDAGQMEITLKETPVVLAQGNMKEENFIITANVFPGYALCLDGQCLQKWRAALQDAASLAERTGEAGEKGEFSILLADEERVFLKKNKYTLSRQDVAAMTEQLKGFPIGFSAWGLEEVQGQEFTLTIYTQRQGGQMGEQEAYLLLETAGDDVPWLAGTLTAGETEEEKYFLCQMLVKGRFVGYDVRAAKLSDGKKDVGAQFYVKNEEAPLAVVTGSVWPLEEDIVPVSDSGHLIRYADKLTDGEKQELKQAVRLGMNDVLVRAVQAAPDEMQIVLNAFTVKP